MKKFSLVSFFSFAFFTNIFAANASRVEVRPPVLKFTIFTAMSDIYVANVLAPEKWAEFYTDIDTGTSEYYTWMINTYEVFSSEEKADFKEIMENVNAWGLMNTVKDLDDEAGIKTITNKVSSLFAPLPFSVKSKLKSFLPVFYNQYFKGYFESNRRNFIELARSLTEAATEKANPFDFIEEISGINLGDYECVFYYTFQKIGAYGFRPKDKRISTLQANVDSFDLLYKTPFHEYSHEFFQTFTKDKEFEKLAEEVREDNGFYEYWDSNPNLKNSYNWRAFLEENLVEGFAMFLRFKFYGKESESSTYYYDRAFYEYLKEIEFDSSSTKLEKVSFDFYKGRLN